MSQTENQRVGLTRAVHHISVGKPNSKVGKLSSESETTHTFKPVILQLSCSSQEKPGSPEQTGGNLKGLIVRRRSLEVNVGHDTICRTHPADQVCSDWPGRHLARDSLTVRRDSGSITTFALPPPTKAVAITIGGANHDAVGWPGSTLSMRDSPERVHAPSLNRAVASTCNDPGRRFSTSIGTQVVRASRITSPSGFTTRVPIAVDSVLFTPPSGSVSAVPFAVVDTAAGPSCINRVHTASSNHPAQATSCSRSIFYRTNSISSARPPLPTVESEVAIGQTAVRISASKGFGFVVSTSNARELRLVASNIADRRQAYILHSSGSCESLQGHTIKLDVRPSRRTAGDITRPLRTSSSLDRSGSFIFVGQQGNTVMPNSPSSGGLGSAKVSCSATSHGTNHQTRITPPPDCSMSGGRSSPGCSHGNIFGISPVIVPSSGKPSSNPTLTSLKVLRPPKKQVKQEQYFRVQLPCTRAASRSKDFVVTDSLKLYENQIFSHCDAAQRPQSWCIDLGPAVDELPLAGDSHSVSPTSTVSSLSSSSSSDASQDYREVPRSERAYQAFAPPRVFHWPVNLGSPISSCKKQVEDALTPTSTPPENASPGFKLVADTDLPPSQIHLHLCTDPTPSICKNVISASDEPQKEFSGQSLIFTQAEPINTLLSRFDTVRPVTDSSLSSSSTSSSRILECSVLPSQTSADLPTPADAHTTSSSLTRTFLCEDCQLPTTSTEGDNQEPHPLSLTTSNLSAASDVQSERCDPEHFSGLRPSCDKNILPVSESVVETNKPLEFANSPVNGLQDTHLVRKPSLRHCPLAEVEDDCSLYNDPDQNAVPPQLTAHDGFPSSRSINFEASDTEVFTTTTPLSYAFHQPLDVDSSDGLIPSIFDDGTYAFSTLDSDYLAWMRLSVRDITGDPLSLTPEMLDNLSRTQVHRWVDMFNLNSMGLRLNFVDSSCRLAGTLRIYMNLIKPVKMSLRQTMDILSPLPDSCDGMHAEDGEAQQALPAPARLVSFFLPRGTSKVIYITSATTSADAIQCLLDRFHIQESSRKFALYEHTLEKDTIVARRLGVDECPLLVLLNWVRTSQNRWEFSQLLLRKRIVLQENDGCDINWNEFTTAELTNFLRILDKEESEYKNAILHQYGMLKDQVEWRLNELDHSKQLKVPTYGRACVSDHPHAFEQGEA
ncbi:hypothetical protein CSKR_201143 [Clonorchis sinensis]|uniref:Ras-associating domain-containing protein n=1 Tax=Clonorchis sinensis TaxID=79923 RepID=A0A8T1MMP1_CLOSI|nr:hypothetical protein CSKR_201143 [Clonorchis sinensis]